MTTQRITELLNTIRHQLDEVQQLANQLSDPTSSVERFPVFDPERDVPPVTPLVDGTRQQRDWCGLMLWGRLRALQKRQGRGATPEESVEIAKAAGYLDGRGWNAWRSRWTKDADGLRCFVEPQAMETLRHYYQAVGRSLPDDLA